MTEAEWLACTDPRLLLVFLEEKASDRKARLFACGVARYLWPFLGDKRSHQVIEVAENYADRQATATELMATQKAALDVQRGTASRLVCWAGDRGAWQGARMAVVSIQLAQTDVSAKDWSGKIATKLRRCVECVFGNPFRPVAVNPRWFDWNNGSLSKLAQRIYQSRDFNLMPALADALVAAGCTNDNILRHCRESGEHVRGCWVVDLILGKS